MKILSSKIGKVAVLSALAAIQMGSRIAHASSEIVLNDVFVSVSCDSKRTYPEHTSAIATVFAQGEEMYDFVELTNARVARDFWDASIKLDWKPLAYGELDYSSTRVNRFKPETSHAKMGAYGFKFESDLQNFIPGSNRVFWKMRPVVSDGRESGSLKCFEQVRQFVLVDLIAKEMRGQ